MTIPKYIIEQHQAGDFESVAVYYEEKIRSEPKEAIWPALLGVLYAQQHDYETARPLLETSVAVGANPDNLAQLATVYGQLGLWDEAAQHFEHSFRLRPFAPRVHNNCGLMYLKQGKHSKAESHFLMALSQDGQIWEAYFNLGLCDMRQSNTEAAIHRFQQALSLHPEHSASHYQLGLAYELMGHMSAATSSYRACLELTPHADASHGLGRCLMKEGLWEEALSAFQESIALGASNHELWHNLGLCYLQLSSPALAVEAWLQANAQKRTLEGLYHLGVAYQQLMRYDDAVVYFKEVITQDPAHLDSLMNLIAIAIERFDTESAQHYLSQALHHHSERPDLLYLQASLTQHSAPDRAPPGYIAQLFDHYAHHYDTHLDYLRYQFPKELQHLLSLYAPKQAERALDLGCGSGLCGPMLRPYVHELIGVDLSPAMLRLAASKHIYTSLVEQDVLQFLDEDESGYAIIVMGELLPYFGDLSLLGQCAERLLPGGIIVLSIERSDRAPYHLHEHARFAHQPQYVIDSLPGLDCIHSETVTLRTQLGQGVSGEVMVFLKAASVR